MVKPSIKIAVTGGVASGKSTVCRVFEKLGIWVGSADQFAREAVKKGTPAYHKIIDHFGKSVLKKDGCINRELLRECITQNHHDRVALEQILHPEILSLMKAKLDEAQKNGHHIVMEVPLLFELSLENLFDLTIMVYSEETVKMQRLQIRDDVSPEKALSLIDLQIPDTEKIERADFVIHNSGSQEQLANDVEKLYKKILK